VCYIRNQSELKKEKLGMWFNRMELEVWFDTYQYEIDNDIGESAVKTLSIKDIGIDLNKIFLRYGYHKGNPDLRACIAEQYCGLSEEQILVTTGASEANFAIVAALVTPGDHVIIEHPNYPSLYEVPRSLGCRTDLLTLRFEDRFKPDIDELERRITQNTKLVSLTHPNNPTGSMISQKELKRIIDLVESYDTFLLFDETYRHLAFDDILPPAAALSPNVISISSMSKCYGLPGIRTGWLATKNQMILDSVLAIREQLSISNNALSEIIALAVLRKKDLYLSKAKERIRKNLDIVADWMKTQKDLEWIFPTAGVVSFPRLKSSLDVDPEDLYRLLAEKYKTFVIPGRCFEMPSNHFRLGYGADAEEIRSGLENFEKALAELKGG
jgi:aspartate/methionine/tyrosine aminotransferase